MNNEIKRAKRSYINKELQDNASNPDKFWKIIKEIFPTKIKSNKTASSFKLDHKAIKDKMVISEEFCKFFSSVAIQLKRKAFFLKNFVWGYRSSHERYSSLLNFKLSSTSDTEVLKHLRKLKRKCATGPDNIPACFLKDVCYVIAKPLTHVINLSLTTGIVPNDLKLARITPIYKSGDSHSFDNYRPISILPVVSKVFEKCVHIQLMDYLESSNLLSSYQFGYQSKRSTELATAYFTDKIRQAMDKGEFTGAIYVDLSKAFDTISHGTIISKLPQFGITGTSQDWLASYLFDRKQQVRYKGTSSSQHPVFCGVPQGSILGPLLFLLIFNDATKSISTCKMLMYADDTVLFYSGKDLVDIQKNLENDFKSLCNWFEVNELIINTKAGKTETMVFGTAKKLNKIDNHPLEIKHKDKVINHTSTYKYLGLNLTSTLSMNEQLRSSLKKASTRINLLKKMKFYIDTKTAALIYQSMILPILTFCPLTMYGSTPQYIKDKTIALEDRAERIIGGNYRVRSSENKKCERVCSFVHQCLYGNTCDVFENYFHLKKTRMATRNNGSMVDIPQIRLEVARASFYFQGASIFNKLPIELRKEKCYSKFMKSLKEFSF